MTNEPFSEPPVREGERIWTVWDTRRSAVAAIVIVGGGLVARDGVPEIERDVFEIINQMPAGLHPVLWAPMQIGSLGGGLLAAAALGAATKRWLVGAAGVGAVVSAWVGAKLIKDVVNRSRPFELIVDTVVRDGNGTGLGYVSGHTAVAFAIYAVAAPHLGRGWRAVALGLAVLVGVARIYVGAHLPLDVVGGAGLGMLVGAALRAAESTITRHRAGAGSTSGLD